MKREPVIAYNIEWDIDIDEVLDSLSLINEQERAKALDIPLDKYLAMSEEERRDYATSHFHHCPGALYDYLGLPAEVTIPEKITENEDITDWLSDKFGYCLYGYVLSTD